MDGLPKSGPPGPCTAATNGRSPGRSMAPQPFLLGPSVAPQVVPPAITGPSQNQWCTHIFTHDSDYMILWFTCILSEDSWNMYDAIDELQKEGFKVINNKNFKRVTRQVREFHSLCFRAFVKVL